MARIRTRFTIANGQTTSNTIVVPQNTIEVLMQIPAADGTVALQFALDGTNFNTSVGGTSAGDFRVYNSRAALSGSTLRAVASTAQTAARTFPAVILTDDNERTFN